MIRLLIFTVLVTGCSVGNNLTAASSELPKQVCSTNGGLTRVYVRRHKSAVYCENGASFTMESDL